MGWRAIFLHRRCRAVAIAVVLLFYLPESIKFLLTRRNDADAIRQIIARFRSPMVSPDSPSSSKRSTCRTPIRHLFTEGRYPAPSCCGCHSSWASASYRCDAVDAGVAAAQRHLRRQHRLCDRVQRTGRFHRPIDRRTIDGTVRNLARAVAGFLLGTAATIGLGYGASSVALAATFVGLVGLFLGLGTAGAIALSALIYPTPIRSTGVGWGMAMGRFGQIVGPLIAGALLGAGWTADKIMIVIACAGLIAAIFILLFRFWYVSRGGDQQSADEMSGRTPIPT